MTDNMDSVLASSVVARRFRHRFDNTKDYKIDSCCFSAKHTASRSKNKDRLAQNLNNASEWSDMSTHGFNELAL